jgi:hypothetical protein
LHHRNILDYFMLPAMMAEVTIAACALRQPTEDRLPPVFAVVFSLQIINGLTVCIATGSKAMGGDYEH